MMGQRESAGEVRWYEFGPYRLDTRALVLFRRGRVVRLPLKAVETLVALARRPGEVLPKSELPGGAGISRNISLLRRALSAPRPVIETVPRRGYRLASKVRSIQAGKGDASPTEGSAALLDDAVDVVLGWCSSCDRHVWVASPKDAAAALGTTMRAVFRAIETGEAHYRETTAGDISVCMPSLIETQAALRRSAR